MLLVIVDVDGTIADLGPRLKAAGMEPDRTDKKVFQEWLDKVQNYDTLAEDRPIKGMRRIAIALDDHAVMIYLTGRSEKFRAVTEAWLDKHSFPAGELIMRKNNDWRSAARYKRQAIQSILKGYPEITEVVAIDDDGAGDCEDVYNDLGITHLKVVNKYG